MNPKFWPGSNIPKSYDNAFWPANWPKVVFASEAAQQQKAKQHEKAVSMIDSAAPLKGLSEKARKALQVPSKRVNITVVAGAKSRIPVINKVEKVRI